MPSCEISELKLPRLTALYFATFELWSFALAVFIIAAVHSWLGASTHELWLIPEWWVVIVLMLLDALREGVRDPSPRLRGLDATAIATALGIELVAATVFLTMNLVHEKRPDAFPIPHWYDDAQKAFLLCSVLSFMAVKYRTKGAELTKEIQPAPLPPSDKSGEEVRGA